MKVVDGNLHILHKLPIPTIDLVILDWSGTISDDRKPVYEASVAMHREFGMGVPAFEEWITGATGDAATYFHTLGVQEPAGKILQMYEKHFGNVVASGLKPTQYQDALDVLQHITKKGKRIVILSTHPQKHLEMEADEYGLSRFIDSIIGNSPDKSADLMRLCKKFGTKPENTVLVGDMVHDIHAARRAGVVSVAVSTGYNSRDKLSSENPDYLISSLSELKKII